MPRAFYFGCRGALTPGHYLQGADGRTIHWIDRDAAFIPESWRRLIDGGLLSNGKVPDRETGVCSCVPARPQWIAFVWWDRSGDERPGSNSGFYVEGFDYKDRVAALIFAQEQFPGVIARQRFPLVIRDRPSVGP